MVAYEWDVEEVTADEYEDVVEHYHQGSYEDCLKFINSNPTSSDTLYRIVLVKDEYTNKHDGRSWAYVVDNTLPETFFDAYNVPSGRVPKRFHQEIQRC